MSTPNDFPAYAAEQNIGKSRHRGALEDRIHVATVTTAGGLEMLVAMVADGIGGGNYGERAAQLAIDVTFATLEAANATEASQIARLLGYALTKANRAVYDEAQSKNQVRGMGSTATIAAVHESKLYIANVGDSRAYLIRDKAVIQLTRDHSWANEMVRLGRLTPEQAETHPKAEQLTRSIGYEETVNIDLGLYVDGNESGSAAVANQGFALTAGDRLVVCSDGLIKSRHDDPTHHYVEDEEMVQAVTRYRPEKSAELLVNQALERDVDDNVSAIVLEMPGSKRAFYVPRAAWYGLAALLLIAALATGGMALANRPPEEAAAVTPTPTVAPTEVVVEGAAADGAATVAPTPDPVNLTVLNAGIDASHQPGSRIPVGNATLVQAGTQPMELLLPDGTALLMAAETQLRVSDVAGVGDSTATRMTLQRGSLVVEAFPEAGQQVVLANQLGDEIVLREGDHLAGITIDEFLLTLTADCFIGSCGLTSTDGAQMVVPEGQYGVIDGVNPPTTAGPARHELFQGLSGLVPTATPTSTPTDTPTPTPTNTPTNTPTPRPTATPTPTPTDTPIPPTRTPLPTAPPAQPTDTPVPPPDEPPPGNGDQPQDPTPVLHK